ncbi:PEBP-like protein [Macrolepiota fuliginosa MF-IS2]|uniref:PEBP-like protein n=1 Tax=Macrolepiota fuliginosa MF-IS2 TaxID=1400762 RepID=A0A9P6C4F7_9AGAR|nr:PEBP-like protein [Macrolepiota fuliginosa MF-IS2]
MRAWALLTAAVLPLVAAQANGDINLGISAIEAHFNQSHIVPDFLSTFEPKGLLDVNFGVYLNIVTGTGNIQPGQKFTKDEVGSAPTLTVHSPTTLNGQYVLAMLDADVPGAKLPQGTNRHWLVYNVTVGQDSTISNATGTAISRYFGPGPAAGSGPHRYVILVYSQPSGFAAPAEFSQPEQPVAPMDWSAFVTNSHLGDLIAANYIQVEEGTATASLLSTVPVVTSTLAVSSTASGSAPASSATSPSGNQSNGSGSLSIRVPIVMGLVALPAYFLA